MKLDITGIHIEVTNAIKEFAEKKIEKLAKFFDEDTICHLTFSAKKEKQHVDIRIEYKSHTYLADEETDDVYYGIESAIEKLESQIRKQKSVIDKKRHQDLTQNEEELEDEIEE